MNLLNKLLERKELGLMYSQIHPGLPLVIFNYTNEVQYEELWNVYISNCYSIIVLIDDRCQVVDRAKSLSPKFFQADYHNF